MRSLVVPIADIHAMLKIGLMPPKVVERPGEKYEQIYRQNKRQKWIWKRWCATQRKLFGLKVDEIVVFLMGDMIHGDKKDFSVHSTKLRTQSEAAVECILPYANRSSKSYAVSGTEWHVGPDGNEESWIAGELGCYKRVVFDKLEVSVQGVRFMLQHKGPSLGSRKWIRGNGMRYTLKDAHIRALERGTTASDIYLWAHFHTYHHEALDIESAQGVRTIHGYTCPAWVTADEYSLMSVKNLEFSDVGLIYFIVEDGKAECFKAFERFDNVERVKHG